MNIFEFARDKEKQAEGLYRILAGMGLSEGMTALFTRLADAEKDHYIIIKKIETAEKIDISSSDILSFAQETIDKMKSGEVKFKMATSQIEVYKAAQAQEDETEKFYLEHSEKSTDEHQRKVLLALAKEEHQHCIVLENIIEFISFPENHPENAEYNTKEE
ncbi:MAG: ferritin family protein [Candidatus Riflebacteria bacterium]|nr:ferritin family protein [Candidatus Riflebacteria bacterium]